jgi:hypothetical protein
MPNGAWEALSGGLPPTWKNAWRISGIKAIRKPPQGAYFMLVSVTA